MDKNEIINIAKKTIKKEADSLMKIIDFIDDDFASIVEKIQKSTGRIIITGIGKSAIIGQKIVASLNSTGTPAIFMHAADAIHGDLGIIQSDDIVICISKSGNTPEIKVLIPLIKHRKNTLIAIVSDQNSFLAKSADYILKATVDSEACPYNLAPTASTTAQLAIGDALTIALLEANGFTSEDFAKYHPGGSLGKRLYLSVDDIYVQNETPRVSPKDTIITIIQEISSKRLGTTAVTDSDNNLLGIITDGDIRRMLQKFENNFHNNITANDIMSKNPKSILKGELAVNALKIITTNNITQVVVVDKNNKYLGFVHLHDLMREGIV